MGKAVFSSPTWRSIWGQRQAPGLCKREIDSIVGKVKAEIRVTIKNGERIEYWKSVGGFKIAVQSANVSDNNEFRITSR